MEKILTIVLFLKILSAAVNTPSQSSPPDGSSINFSTPTFIWNGVSDATTYYLQVSTDSTFSNITSTGISTNVLISTTTIAPTTYFVTIVPLDENLYYWRVAADSGTPSSFSGWSLSWTIAIDTTPPGAVNDLTASPGDVEGEVKLVWTSPGDDGFTGTLTGEYRIQFSSISTFTGWSIQDAQVSISTSSVTPSTVSSIIVTGLIGGVTYYFRLWTRDEAINWSDISNAATSWAQVDVTPPGGITTLTLSPKFRNMILEWISPGDDDYSNDIIGGKYFIRYATYQITSLNWDDVVDEIVISTTTPPGQNQFITISGLTNGTTYWFAIKTCDESNNLSQISNVENNYPVNLPPNLFIQKFPRNYISLTTIVTFYWTNEGDPDENYGDQISSYTLIGSSTLIAGVLQEPTTKYYNIPPSEFIYEGSVVSSIAVNISFLQENTTYYWEVIAYDSESANEKTGAFSTVWFAVNLIQEPPSGFELTYASGIVTTLTPILQWTEPVDPDPGDYIKYYTIYISEDPTFSFTYSSSGLKTNSFSVPAGILSEDTTYYWKVKAFDTTNLVSESDIWKMITNATNSPPLPFDLYSPTQSTTVYNSPLTLDWEDAIDPDPGDYIWYYLVYLSSVTSDVFSTLQIATTDKSSYVVNGLVENATYWWGIKARDRNPDNAAGGIKETASATWYFLVDLINEPPNKFSLISPTGSINNLTPTFSWNQTYDPDPTDRDYPVTYELYYSTWPDFQEVISTTTSNTSFIPAEPLMNLVTYYWNVKAIDRRNPALYNTAITTFAFIILNTMPNPFSVLYPTSTTNGNGIINTSSPTFRWEETTDPENDSITYDLYYSLSSDFASEKTTEILNLTTNYYESSGLLENSTYWWKVEAKDEWGNVRTTSVEKFWVDVIPESPSSFSLLQPPDDSKVNTKKPEFKWESATDPDPKGYISSYKIYYSSSPNNIFSAETTSNSYIPAEDLAENGIYNWWVEAKDNDGLVTFSTTFTVIVNTVDEPPNEFELISPLDGSKISSNSVILSWEDASVSEPWDTIKYKLYYEFDGVTTTISDITTTSIQLELPDDKCYTWWVEAKDEILQTRLSKSKWVFAIDVLNKPPENFNLLAPANGSTLQTLKPEFKWESTTDSDPFDSIKYYVIYHSTAPDFAISSSVVLNNTSFTPTTPLLQNTTYYWYVKAFDQNDSFTATPIWNFYITPFYKPAAVKNLTGKIIFTGKYIYLTLSWDAVKKNEDGSDITDLKGYKIYSSDELKEFSVIGTTSETSYSVSIESAKNYFYYVKAYNIYDVEGERSEIMHFCYRDGKLLSGIVNSTPDRNMFISVPPEENSLLNAQGLKLEAKKVNEEIYETIVYSSVTLVDIPYYKFKYPVEINFKITNQKPGLSPALYWFNGVEYEYRQPTISGGWAKIKTYYSGRYKIKYLSLPSKFKIVQIVPKKIFTPYAGSKYPKIKFKYFNPGVDIPEGEIYDINGRFVSKMKNNDLECALEWDGKDNSGHYVLKGIYLYRIKCGDEVFTGTVIVAR